MPGTVVVGAQWGDEGKGKITDLLAEKADVVARFQGGNNAGHTIVRDGEGPFPTELFDETGIAMCEVGHEFGTTTGRQRRCGWLDLVALKYAVRLSGITHLAITKLDVLSGMPTVKVCTRYKAGRRVLDEFPLLQTDFHHARPIFEELPGWTEDIRECDTWQDLPQTARDYIQFIAEFTKTRVKFIAVGPGREETIILPRSIGRGGAV